MDLRDRILAADDLDRAEVECPEWGLTVTVRGMTAGEVERFGHAYNEGDESNVMARLVSYVVIDPETGDRVFSEDDIEAIAGKSTGVIKRLFDAAQAASGLGEDIEGN